MSRSPSSGQVSQAERLRQALEETGISRRTLAVQLRGPKGTPSQINYTKSQLVKWLGAKHGIGDANAERLAAALNALLGKIVYDPDYFKNPDAPKTYAEAMKENEELRSEVARLRQAAGQ